ncbi:SLAP domain-containing protein [Radiobacillus kanasensis]|uniref:SLAP domain-containing protein n=1 Tax=Radiobacillus kanasensis TaxID=2844358 RepID=UPI001E5B07CD|nr:SLAP domain-containing protein [Radiobacillus kanasensis]UFU00748.1 SLAP domain-containing protein [Radiobacillus kanasensis]
MQKLVFEEKWDKTIANADRFFIEKVFSELTLNDEDIIQFTPIRQAVNHKEDLLVTVIIHNTSGEGLSLNQQKLSYMENDYLMAEETFFLPVVLPPFTSMPWTFIFPRKSIQHNASLKNGCLVI